MSHVGRVHLLLPLRNQCLPAMPKDGANPILGRQILWRIRGLDVTECDVLPRWGTQWERSRIAQGLAQVHALHCDKVRVWFRSQDHRTRRWLILQHDGKRAIVRSRLTNGSGKELSRRKYRNYGQSHLAT